MFTTMRRNSWCHGASSRPVCREPENIVTRYFGSVVTTLRVAKLGYRPYQLVNYVRVAL